MSLLQRIKDKLLPHRTLLSEEKSQALQAVARPLVQPSGHVIHTKRPEYTPDSTRHGGRVVKTMPRALQKIKEAQEKLDDTAL